jgi:hypothetical protein
MRNSFLPRSTLRAQSTRRFLNDETRYASIDLDVVVPPQISFYFIIRSVILELCGYPSREKPAKPQHFFRLYKCQKQIRIISQLQET